MAGLTEQPFVRIMLPVLGRCSTGQHAVQVPYWSESTVCPCCGETKSVRWIDAFHHEVGHCNGCRLSRVPLGRSPGLRCAMHRRWDADQATKKTRPLGAIQ